MTGHPSKPICSLAKGNAPSNCHQDKRLPVSPGLEPYGNDRSPREHQPTSSLALSRVKHRMKVLILQNNAVVLGPTATVWSTIIHS
ncbi:hypothetical protein FJTKL_14782 [Diaporthe vaccinii]|uniref:Uncharacterized protein n=1 Tax=Diaporthe vaccinii TaxID=105482 RepID=A0ABR4F7Y5_9PEZI